MLGNFAYVCFRFLYAAFFELHCSTKFSVIRLCYKVCVYRYVPQKAKLGDDIRKWASMLQLFFFAISFSHETFFRLKFMG